MNLNLNYVKASIKKSIMKSLGLRYVSANEEPPPLVREKGLIFFIKGSLYRVSQNKATELHQGLRLEFSSNQSEKPVINSSMVYLKIDSYFI